MVWNAAPSVSNQSTQYTLCTQSMNWKGKLIIAPMILKRFYLQHMLCSPLAFYAFLEQQLTLNGTKCSVEFNFRTIDGLWHSNGASGTEMVSGQCGNRSILGPALKIRTLVHALMVGNCFYSVSGQGVVFTVCRGKESLTPWSGPFPMEWFYCLSTTTETARLLWKSVHMFESIEKIVAALRKICIVYGR